MLKILKNPYYELIPLRAKVLNCVLLLGKRKFDTFVGAIFRHILEIQRF